MISTEQYAAQLPSNEHGARTRGAFGNPSAPTRRPSSWAAAPGHQDHTHDDNFIHRSDPPIS